MKDIVQHYPYVHQPTNPLHVADVIRPGGDVSLVTNERGHLPQRDRSSNTPPCETFVGCLSSAHGNRRQTDRARRLATLRETEEYSGLRPVDGHRFTEYTDRFASRGALDI